MINSNSRQTPAHVWAPPSPSQASSGSGGNQIICPAMKMTAKADISVYNDLNPDWVELKDALKDLGTSPSTSELLMQNFYGKPTSQPARIFSSLV